MGLTEFVNTMSSNQDVVDTFKEVGIDNVSAIRALLVEVYTACQDKDPQAVADFVRDKYTNIENIQIPDDIPETEEQLIEEYEQLEAQKKINPLSIVLLVTVAAGIFFTNLWVVIGSMLGAFILCNSPKYNNLLKPIIIFVGVIGLLIMLGRDINVNPTMFGDTVTDILDA